MSDQTKRDIGIREMTDPEFFRFGNFIARQCGIKMPLSKKTMLQTRLQKRLRALGISSFTVYADYVFSPQGEHDELHHMIDAATTNKTDFFREPAHFEFLKSRVLAAFPGDTPGSATSAMTVWSAGCSTGEEPYTLSMILSEHAIGHSAFRFSILATDISTKVLQQAAAAIYPHEKIQPVPMALRKRYLLRSPDAARVRICPELRSRVTFCRLNFMERSYNLPHRMDVIFCRNVIIYFDRPTQQTILERICRQLKAGGYLFMGHSETLGGMNLPLSLETSSVYRKHHENA